MVRYEMNRSKLKIDRTIYGALDWLGDIGGFNEAMSWFAMLFLALFQYEPLYTHLIAKLYEMRDPPTDHPRTPLATES